MDTIPSLTTKRLILRPFDLEDAGDVQKLAGDERIAATALNMPHPYLDGMAEEWISTHQKEFNENKQIIWAITWLNSGKVIGAIGLTLNVEFNKAEAGYWIGVPYWSNGYASEAMAAVIKYSFEELKLNKIYAHHVVNNNASGRVMIKNGMKKEGYLREEVRKDGEYIDIILYSILRKEYSKRNKKNN